MNLNRSRIRVHALVALVPLLLAACAGGLAPAVKRPTVAAKTAPPVVATKVAAARALKFVGSTKDGSPAPQPDVIEIRVNGKAIALEREPVSGDPTIPADTSGTVDALTAKSKVSINVAPVVSEHGGSYRSLADSPDDLTVVLLPWKAKWFIGEALDPADADFKARLKKRAVHYPLALSPLTDANVAGVYIGHYRLPRHTYYIDQGDLYADVSSEYYVRLSKANAVPSPLLRLVWPNGAKVTGVAVTVAAYPALLKAVPTPAPSPTPTPDFVPAPTMPENGTTDVKASDLAVGAPSDSDSLAAFESDVVAIDDTAFPDPGP